MSGRVLIVGGGITGLAAAYELLKRARAVGRQPEITVVERDARLGGQVQTVRMDGLIMEEAPDSFLARKPWFGQLAKELGLPLIGTNPAIKKTYILHKGRLEPIPPGMQLFIPTRLKSFAGTRLVSRAGKVRAMVEPFIPVRESDEDETISDFVTRRFGREVLDTIGAPLMAGVYGDTYELSMKATFPQFLKMEREKGSVLRAVRKAAPAQGTTGSAFQTVTTGLVSVVEALVKATNGGVRYLTGVGVTGIARQNGGYTVELSNGEQVGADAVVITTPAYTAADLVERHVPEVAAELRSIDYLSVVVAALAYNRADVDHPLDATGFLAPKAEPLEITASTWVSSKWSHAAPEDKVLLRGYLGRDGGKDWTAESDEAIIAAVRRSLEQVMGLQAEPIITRVFRWARSRPRYKIGHLERVARIERGLERAPGLYLAGAAYRGAGLPDCVRDGQVTAERIAKQLNWM